MRLSDAKIAFWHRQAERQVALRRLDAIEAACVPGMKKEDLHALIARLRRKADTETAQAPVAKGGKRRYTAEQEAEWAANRKALALTLTRRKLNV